MDRGSEPASGENHQSAEATGSVETGGGRQRRRNSEPFEKRDEEDSQGEITGVRERKATEARKETSEKIAKVRDVELIS